MPRDYGYDQRADPPNRAVPAPEARVTAPRRLEARETEKAIKAPPADVDSYVHLFMMIGDRVVPIGNAFASGSGGTGPGATTTFGWRAPLARYSRRIVVTGTSGFGAGYHAYEYTAIMTPRAWLDPDWDGSHGPGILRYADVVRFEKTSAPVTQGWVTARWGIGTDSIANIGDLVSFIGFVCQIDDTVSTGTWRLSVTDGGGASLYSVVTSFASTTLHRLELEFDAGKHVVRWYVDGTKVGEWSPSSSQVPGDVSGVSKRFVISCQAQGPGGGLQAQGTLDYGMDGWFSGAASFDSPAL